MFLLMLVMQKKRSIAVFILVKTFIEGIQKLEETKSTIKSGAKKKKGLLGIAQNGDRQHHYLQL